jgi:uncharacterized protein (DUF4415 family)
MTSMPEKAPPLTAVSDEEDRLITAAAESDPDNLPLTDEELADMVPIQELADMVPVQILLGRPPKPDAKQLVSIRYQPAVLAYFRSTGPGWQARMDAVLAEHVRRVTADPND